MSTEQEDTTVEFTPIRAFKASDSPPDAPAGSWQASFTVLKTGATKDKGDGLRFPMLTIGITLDEANDESNAPAAGVQLKDWLIIYPNGHKNQRMAKDRITAVAEALGFDPDAVIPEEITQPSDLDAFAQAIEGGKAQVWTSVKTREDNTKETRVHYSAPRRRN